MKYLILLLLISANANADYRHNYKIPDVSVEGSGTALSIAMGQLKVSRATRKWQGNFGWGNYDGSNAFAFGLGKKYKDVLINGSVGLGDKAGFGVGANWKF